MLKTPILFVIFKRPEKSLKVIEKIREIAPKKLYIVADGARENINGEKELCEKTRSEVLNAIDWDCEVKTKFSDFNLGCGINIYKGIDWFFENEEEGIILEDDCVPNTSFFKFCEELLNYYKFDKRIMHISGNNWQFGIKRGNASYYFSHYSHNWGWATWKRAWKHFDFEMKKLDDFIKSGRIKKILITKEAQDYWINYFIGIKKDLSYTWDAQWLFAIWLNNGLSIIPSKNLVTNLGTGEDATHTKEDSYLMNHPTEEISFPIKHPLFKRAHKKADLYTYKKVFSMWNPNKPSSTSTVNKIKNKLKHIFKL